MQRLDTTATVYTPERVSFRYRLAGPGRRGAAWVLDLVVRVAALFVMALLMLPFGAVPELASVGGGLVLVGMFLLDWFYGVFFESVMAGQTPGKKLMSIRVVRADGAPAQLPDLVLRNLMRAVDVLPVLGGVGLVTMLIDDRLRRLGDLVAGTVVVVESRSHVLRKLLIDPPITDEERRELPARVDMSRDEIALVEEFLRRRRTLSAERAEELARLFGPTLAQRTGVSAPSWERTLALAYARATGKDRQP